MAGLQKDLLYITTSSVKQIAVALPQEWRRGPFGIQAFINYVTLSCYATYKVVLSCVKTTKLHNNEIKFFKREYSEFMTTSYIQATKKKILHLTVLHLKKQHNKASYLRTS